MAWWDYEDLKSPEYKSARYKLAFPKGYTQKELDEARIERQKELDYIDMDRRINKILKRQKEHK